MLMRKTWPLVTLALGFTACADDPAQTSDTEDTSSTASPTSTAAPGTSSGDETTSGSSLDGTTSGSTGGTSTGPSTEDGPGPIDTSSTGEPGSSSESGDESSGSGALPPEPWGDCINLPADACLPGDTCINDEPDAPAFGVCVTPDCTTEADCPAAPITGDAPVACLDVTADELTECVLDCSAGQTCPDGMGCYADTVCTHSLVAYECAESTIGGSLPVQVSGTTAGATNDFAATCSLGDSLDDALQWTAPVTGTWVLHTQGSAFDTVLSVYDGCDGPLLACNDDGPVQVTCGGYPCSQITLDLDAGDTVLVLVDGYNASGAYDLTIDLQGDFGNCCDYQDEPGCEVPAVESCVCALDNFCCKVVWDDICAGHATSDCGAACP